MTPIMFVHDIMVEYRDPRNDELLLIILSTDEDKCYSIPLVQGEKEWSSGVKYLEVNSSSLWVTVTVFDGKNECLGHVLWEALGHTSSGQNKLGRDVRESGAVTLGRTISQERPDGYTALSQTLSPSHPIELARLASTLRKEFTRTGNVHAILGAISLAKTAATLTQGDSQMGSLLMDLGEYQRVQAGHALPSRLPDIEESISNLKRALVLIDPGDSEKLAECLGSLSESLFSAYYSTDLLYYLDEAVDAGKRCVGFAADNDPRLSTRLFYLARVFDTRFRHAQVLDDAEQATLLLQQAIGLTESQGDTPTLAVMLDKLAIILSDVFTRTGDMSHILLSIQTYRRAANLAVESELAGALTRLGRALCKAFYQAESPSYLEEAVSVSRRSVALTSENDPDLPERLQNLGDVLWMASTDLQGMQEAISCYRRAVDMTPKTDKHYYDRLVELSDALAARATSFTGATNDFKEAISMHRTFVREQDELSPQLPKALMKLGMLLNRRGTLSGDIAHIREAIAAYQKAITLRESGHRDLTTLYASMGNAYHNAFNLSSEPDDMDAAIDSKRKAIDVLPERHTLLPIGLHNLARSIRSKFETDRKAETIEEAIECHERCIKVAPEGHIGLSLWHDAFAQSLSAKFDITGDVLDLDRAIEMSEKALHILPEDHHEIPHFESTLGDSFVKRSKAAHSQEDLRKAITHYRHTALCSRGYVSRRMYAAQKWAEHSRTLDIKSSLEGYERSIELISVLVGLEQTRDRRHDNIANISGLSRSAAATALEAGEPLKAVDWLERGRCLVWSQLNSLRASVDELRSKDERLAERVITVSKALEGSSGPITGNDANVHLALEWNNLIAQVRRIDGFEEFLRTKPFFMNDLPPRGTVVMINVHSDRCDALALRLGWSEPLHIPLSDLSLRKTQRMAEQLREYLGLGGVRMRGYEWEGDEEKERALRRMERGAPKMTLREILRDLWKCVAKPILDTLKQQGSITPEHIWWCPTGPLSFLPLHAAGAYEGGRDTVADFAISSYTPSIRILVNKMRVESNRSGNQNGLLVISQLNTPGHTPLPGTAREVAALRKVLRENTVKSNHFEGEIATRELVAGALGNYHSVHFACHAFQDAKEPLSSGFFLHDGRLELEKIMRRNLKNAELAFLSACQTSTGDEKLSEEAVHLAAGMAAAGYRSVIATMWSIQDKHAPDVTTSFYSELLRLSSPNGRLGIDGTKAAEALHYALRELRAKLGDSEDALLTWVPYVHLGV